MVKPLLRALVRPAVLAVGLSLAATAIVSAATYTAPNFTVYNQGSEVVEQLYVSPHNNNTWGDDLLANYELEPGYSYKPLQNYTLPSCYQDVRAVYDDKHVETIYDVNICTNNVIFHY